ncbi:Alpha-glucosidase 2, partial [Bienertia sinuspersici]
MSGLDDFDLQPLPFYFEKTFHDLQPDSRKSTSNSSSNNGRTSMKKGLPVSRMTEFSSHLEDLGSTKGRHLALLCQVSPDEDIYGTGHFSFYVADEGGHAISLSRDVLDIHEDSLLASGSRRDVGGWQLHLESAI